MTLTGFQPGFFDFRREGDVVVVRVTVKRLSDEENVEQLGDELFTLVDDPEVQKIVLELSEVEYITSSVLGKMITLHRRLHRKHGQLVVCGVTDPVQDILQGCKLDEYFNSAPDADAAVAQLA